MIFCSKCKFDKPADLKFFSLERRNSSGFCSWCRDCRRQKSINYAKNNKEKIALRRKGKRSPNKDILQAVYRKSIKGRMTMWKYSAKIRNLKWNLTLEQVLKIPMVCAYTGQVLSLEPHLFETISLDRVDSAKGYELDNVVFCCEIINKMKQDSTVEEFFRICELVLHNKDATLQILRKHNK